MKITRIPRDKCYPGMIKVQHNNRDIRIMGEWTDDEVRKAVEEMKR